jgi:hypothetical protein
VSVQTSMRRRSLLVLAAAVMVALVAAPAAAADAVRPASPVVVPRAAAHSIVFGGLTSQNWPVVLAISPNVPRLRLAVIGLHMSCSSGGSFAVNDAFGGLAIGRTGKVHAAAAIPGETTPNVTLTGGSHAISATLHFRQATFTGWWHLHLDYMLPDGTADHCDSGRVGFSARL